MVRVNSLGKRALDAVMLEMGRMVAESVVLIEREEVTGPDYYPADPNLQKWVHEEGLLFIGDQKVKVTRLRLGDVVQGEVPLKFYARLHATGDFSEELLEKILRGVSTFQERIMRSARHCSGTWTSRPSALPADPLRDRRR